MIWTWGQKNTEGVLYAEAQYLGGQLYLRMILPQTISVDGQSVPVGDGNYVVEKSVEFTQYSITDPDTGEVLEEQTITATDSFSVQWRLTLNITQTVGSKRIDLSIPISTRHFKTVLPVYPGATVSVSVTRENIPYLSVPTSWYLPIPSSESSVEVDAFTQDGIDAWLDVTHAKLPDGASTLRIRAVEGFTTEGGPVDLAGADVALIDSQAVELPASLWVGKATEVCPITDSESVNGEWGSTCRYWIMADQEGCPFEFTNCSGFRSDCQAYAPVAGCPFLVAKNMFNVSAGGLLKCDEVTAFAMTSGEKLDLTHKFGVAQASVLSALNRAAAIYCHKFGSPEQGKIPCFAWHDTKLPYHRAHKSSLWRFVQADGTLDLTCRAGTAVKVKLKAEDIPVTAAPVPSQEQRLGEISELKVIDDVSLSPLIRMPKWLAPGLYEVWLYCQNTLSDSGFSMSMKWDDRLASIRTNGSATVPSSATLAWVKVSDIVLRNVTEIWFEPFLSGAYIENGGGVFEAVSLYLERKQ